MRCTFCTPPRVRYGPAPPLGGSMYFARISVIALLATCAAACSSSSNSTPSAPVIDDFTLPDTATVATVQTTSGSQQAYDMKGTISFHDDKESVTSYKL